MTPINITALRHSAFYSPLLMTICSGFLQQEGLDPNYDVATPSKPVNERIRNGEVHVSQSAVATSFAALERNEPCDIVHFAQINERDGFFIAAREPYPDFSWEQLVDKDVLVDHFFQPLAMFRYALHKQGIDENCISMIDAGDVNAIDESFRRGRGDFVHQQGPAPQQLEMDGAGYVVASVGAAIGPVAFSSLCASREWLETDMAGAFMRAYRRGRQFVIDTPASEIAKLELDFFPGIDIDVLSKTVDTYKSLGCWAPNPAISEQAYENLLEVFLYNGLISKRHPMSSCVTNLPDN